MFSRDPLANPEPLIRRVYSYAAYRLGDGPDAEDATSDAFERALRSEEHTSELQSPCNLVCRLLLEKKNISDYVIALNINSPIVSLHISHIQSLTLNTVKNTAICMFLLALTSLSTKSSHTKIISGYFT